MSKTAKLLALGAVFAVALHTARSDASEAEALDRYKTGERLALQGRLDFAFMEFQSVARNNKSGQLAQSAAFAVGEYHYRGQNVGGAASYFEQAENGPGGLPSILAAAYLRECARLAGDSSGMRRWENQLKAKLAEQKFLGLFQDTRTRRWTSPLGNRYTLTESVDSMEIRLNDSPFYTISLP